MIPLKQGFATFIPIMKTMKRLLYAIAWLLLPAMAHAQIENYIPGTWKTVPAQHTSSSSLQQGPYTLMDYKVVRDFRVSREATFQGITHYKILYKNIRINNQAAADSLSQLVLPLDKNETLTAFHCRLLLPDGSVKELDDIAQLVHLSDNREAILINGLRLQPGSELEYDLGLAIARTTDGTEYLQSGIPCASATFMLIPAKNNLFSFRSYNGAPAIKDSVTRGSRIYYATGSNITPLEPGNLFYYQPHLQRIDFALQGSVVGVGDTAKVSWNEVGKYLYIPYVDIDQRSFKLLEKEMQQWEFLKRPAPVGRRIYQVEAYVKSRFRLMPDNADRFYDLTQVLRSRETDRRGMVTLLNAVYYMLRIPTHMLFTSSRDTIAPDAQLVQPSLVSNVLLYFPETGQALAPTETGTRYPCFPPLWSDLPALRCRDSLQGKESVVITDFFRTPQVPYTINQLSMEAVIQPGPTTTLAQVKQSFAGYPAMGIKNALTRSNEEERKRVYDLVLPFPVPLRKINQISTQHETWDMQPTELPLTISSTLEVPYMTLRSGNQIKLQLTSLLYAQSAQGATLPPGNIPVETGFPFYQEKRIFVEIPAGYKVKNLKDFSGEIKAPENSQALGYTMSSRVDNNRVAIYVIEWYRQTSYSGALREVFGKIMARQTTQPTELILEKE